MHVSSIGVEKLKSTPSVATQKMLALMLLILQGSITVTGSIVRITGSGLGCNTWPNCHEGSLVPVAGAAPALHQAIEFGNRLITFVIVFFAAAVFVAVYKAQRRKEILIHAGLQILGIIVQAVIGGISVHLDLRWWVVALHFLPSMLLIWLAAILYLRIQEPDDAQPHRIYSIGLRSLAALFALGIALVLITGTMVTGAGVHSGDKAVGPETRLQVDIAWMAHIHAWIMYGFFVVLVLLVAGLMVKPVPRPVRSTGWILIGIIIVQIIVGVTQFRLGVPRWTIPVHIALCSFIVTYSSFLWAQGYSRGKVSDPTTTTGSTTTTLD